MNAALKYDRSSKPGASQRAQLVGIETEQRYTHKWSSVSLKQRAHVFQPHFKQSLLILDHIRVDLTLFFVWHSNI